MRARLWEKRKTETMRAFDAFVLYRDMGPRRTLLLVSKEIKKHPRQCEQWSAKHAWIKRAEAWDGEQDRVGRLAELKEIEKMRKRQTQLALSMQNLGALNLKKLLIQAEKAKKNGDPLDPDIVIKLIKEGAALERLNRGEPNEIVQTTIEDEIDYSILTKDELTQMRIIKKKLRLRK